MWIEVKVRYQAVEPNGKATKKNETYLVQADGCQEAECIALDNLAHITDIEVKCIRVANIGNVVEGKETELGAWYKVAADIISLDEKSGKCKRARVTDLIYAKDIMRALKIVADQYLSSSVEIVKIEKSNIVDIIK